MKINIEEIRINIKTLEDKKTKAIVSLDFGELIIKGFRITESQFENEHGDKLWVQPPSYMGGGRFHPMFYMENKEYWKQLETRIYKEYKSKLNTQHKKKYDIPEAEW